MIVFLSHKKMFPMLIAFNRRVPRTKSVFDRTSSRRYSSLDYDSNGYYDHQQEHPIIDNNNNNGHSRQNHLHFIDSIIGHNDDGMILFNGHDNLTVSFDDNEDDSDEYALAFLSFFYTH
jgi:hypothetical protein